MTIKQFLIAITTIYSLTTINAFASDSSWWRDGDEYYKGISVSPDSRFQAHIQPQGLKNQSQHVGFILVTSNKSYCSDKEKNFLGNLTLAVNNRKIVFNTTCYKGEWLNITPSSPKGDAYVLKEFNNYRNKTVTFVISQNNSPDWVFSFPTKGFGKIYSSIKESIKQPIL